MLKLVDKRLSGHRQVLVRIDNCRHDRLPGEVHVHRARGNVDLPFSAHGSELPIRDNKRRIGNRSTPVAGDQACAFEDRGRRSSLRARWV